MGFASLLIGAVLSQAAFAASVPVEGDRRLFDLVLAAQSTHREELRAGSFHVVSRVAGDEANSDVRWKGSSIRVDYELSMARLEAQVEGGKSFRGVWGETERERWGYWPEWEFAQRDPLKTRRPNPALQLHPRELWYHFQDLMPWERLIDPDEPKNSVVKKLVVHRDGDAVIIERHTANGLHMRLTASLAWEGRIISYDTPLGSAKLFYGGSYEWARAEDGRIYPKRMVWRRSGSPIDESARPYRIFEVTDFRLAAQPEAPFEFSSLRLPEGTEIETLGRGIADIRTTYVGGKPKRPLDDLLKKDAEELKKGFANPGEGGPP